MCHGNFSGTAFLEATKVKETVTTGQRSTTVGYDYNTGPSWLKHDDCGRLNDSQLTHPKCLCQYSCDYLLTAVASAGTNSVRAKRGQNVAND